MKPRSCAFSPMLSKLSLFAGLLALMILSSVAAVSAQQDSCRATCRSPDSPCTGLTGTKFTQCVKQCVQGCPPEQHNPPPPLLDPGCGNRSIQGKIKCTIWEPPVDKHETAVPTVLFAAGDVVDVTADGCVQTGGWGDTWKRYVNPSGPNSGQYYHGLIRIPTGTPNSALVRIDKVIAKHLTVTGQGVPVDQLVLHLGYEDDGYSDNGYYAHDDGTEDQCKSDPTHGKDGGPAHVTLTIYRGVPPDTITTRFDFDVLSNQFDPNGLPYNPMWSWQTRPENQGKTPNTSSCHNFSTRESTLGIPDLVMSPYFGDCTDQADMSSVDLPSGTNATVCRWWAALHLSDTFPGHVNWFPVTLEGHGGWGDHGADDDYTYTFRKCPTADPCPVPGDPQPNPLSVNGRDGLHVEFDSDETIDNFHTSEWDQLHNAVDAWSSAKGILTDCNTHQIPCTPEQIAALQKTIDSMPTFFNGHTVLTGMFGMDGEHGMKAEMHPVYAFATLRDGMENSADDEVWLMFVRNQGDEGYCSSSIWDAGFEDYTFKLPWRSGMRSVDVNWDKTNFDGTDGTSGPTVKVLPFPDPNAGVYVSFHLGPPVHSSYIFDPGASVPFLNGALHLVWSGLGTVGTGRTGALEAQPGAARRAVLEGQPAATHPQKPITPGTQTVTFNAEANQAGDVEEALQSAIHQLPAAKREQVTKARVLSGTKAVAMRPLPKAGKVERIAQPPTIAVARIAKPHAIKAGPAVQKSARDEAQTKALCAAANNAPAGLPAAVCTGTPQKPATLPEGKVEKNKSEP